MNKLILSLVTFVMMATGCKDDSENVGPGTPLPTGIQGKWAYGGSFSFTDFENYDGTYGGKGFEQGMVFNFKPGGHYEMYVINATTSYSCRTEGLTYQKGSITFDESEGSFVIHPQSGVMRGYYSCYPSKNFKRNAYTEELKEKKYYYVLRKNSQGETVLNVSTTPSVNDGIDFDYDSSEN